MIGGSSSFTSQPSISSIGFLINMHSINVPKELLHPFSPIAAFDCAKGPLNDLRDNQNLVS